jgi:hypothetical protein
MDKMREEFEDFARNHYYFCEVDAGFSEGAQEYYDSELQNGWEIWQESRAARKVKLPDEVWAENIGDCVYIIDDIKKMLTDAGINYE